MVVAHHPIIFSGLKKITGKNYIEKAIIAAIKNDIAVYAIHTNLDNIHSGVSNRMADKLGLVNRSVLAPKTALLMKLITFVPVQAADEVRNAIFAAGAGHIGNYAEASFNSNGFGTFKGNETTNPAIGKPGIRENVEEIRIEVLFPQWLQTGVIAAMKAAHPYEEVAYDIIPLANTFEQTGSGIIGYLPEPMDAHTFLNMLKTSFNLSVVRHTPLLSKPLQKIALCGGTGSFLIPKAIAAGADCYITADIKYHEFFDANDQIVIADIGHWESEQYTIDLLLEILQDKFPTFAVLKTEVKTNPVEYF
jgi:dinuclear metal center YbgI/SA1388 family protein